MSDEDKARLNRAGQALFDQMFGPMNRDWDYMRDLVGDAWDDALTQDVFLAYFVREKRTHPKLTKDNLKSGGWKILTRDAFPMWIKNALKNKDSNFFLRLAKSMDALNKFWANGNKEDAEPEFKWRLTAITFIKNHWKKHGCGPSQPAVREHLASMEWYHGKATIQTEKPLTMEPKRKGSFEHIDRTPGRPRKNPPGKSSGAV